MAREHALDLRVTDETEAGERHASEDVERRIEHGERAIVAVDDLLKSTVRVGEDDAVVSNATCPSSLSDIRADGASNSLVELRNRSSNVPSREPTNRP